MALYTPCLPGPQEITSFRLTPKMRLSVSDPWDWATRESKQEGVHAICWDGSYQDPLVLNLVLQIPSSQGLVAPRYILDKCHLPVEVFWEALVSLLRPSPLSFPLDNDLVFFFHFYLFCVVVSQCMCRAVQKTTFGSQFLLPPLHEFLRLNSGCQAYQQAPLPADHRPGPAGGCVGSHCR